MKKFSKIAIFLLLIICGFAMTSCGGGTGDDDTIGGGGYTEDGKLVIEYWHANGAALTTVLEAIAADFEAKNPSYKLKLVSYGDYTTLRDTLGSAISGGIQPTAAQTYPDHVSLYLEGKALQSLDKYINDPQHGMSAAEQAQFIDGFWAEGTIYDQAGTRYAMPFNKSTELMYYNADLFAKYNWEVPTTWAEVVAICDAWKLTPEYAEAVKTYPGLVYPLGYDSEANMFITMTQQFGATYTSLNAENKGVYNAFGANADDTAKSKSFMNFYLQQFQKGNMATSTAFGTDYCSDAFKNGQCIMTIGSSAGAGYNDGQDSAVKKFNTGVSAVPQQDKANGQVIQQGTNVSLFICDTPEEELGGWLWLKHMVSYESALKWALDTSYFPIRRDVLNSTEYQNHINGKKVLENGQVIEGVVTLAAKAKQAGLSQQNWFFTNVAFPGSSQARDYGETIVQNVLYGGISIDKAYENAYNKLSNL